jgi:hypothetical protein
MFFFLLHLTCASRRGSGLVFFIIEWLGKGAKIFFYKNMLKGTGRVGG